MILIDPIVYNDITENEIWIPLFYSKIVKNKYLISNFGNIYDLERSVYINHNNHSAGYTSVTLKCEDGNSYSFLLHRLVAEMFVAKRSEGQNQVNHKNGEMGSIYMKHMKKFMEFH